VGFVYIQPALSRFLGLHDSCGVHNLHGMPGVLAGLASVCAAAAYRDSHLAASLFPHDGATQPLFQLAALGTSVGVGLFGGMIAGLVLRFLPHPKDPYNDNEYWTTEEEENVE